MDDSAAELLKEAVSRRGSPATFVILRSRAEGTARNENRAISIYGQSSTFYKACRRVIVALSSENAFVSSKFLEGFRTFLNSRKVSAE